MAEDLPSARYDAVMASDAALLDWLRLVRDFGLVMMRNVPTDPGEVLRVADRIAYARRTNFGMLFDVVVMSEPNNNA